MIDITVDFSNSLDVGLDFGSEIELSDVFEISQVTGQKYPVYSGSTEVTPTASDQTLATKRKSLESDITVKKVPTYETSNPSGGYTFTILS